MSLPVPTALLYTWIVCDAFILAFLKSIWYISKFAKLVLLTLKNCTIIISFHEAGWSASKHFYQFVEVKINQLLKRNRFVYAIFTFWYCVLESSSVSLNLKELLKALFSMEKDQKHSHVNETCVRAITYFYFLRIWFLIQGYITFLKSFVLVHSPSSKNRTLQISFWRIHRHCC